MSNESHLMIMLPLVFHGSVGNELRVGIPVDKLELGQKGLKGREQGK